MAGVGVASYSWQVTIVRVGSLLRRRTSPRGQALTQIVGHLVVAALGLAMILRPN